MYFKNIYLRNFFIVFILLFSRFSFSQTYDFRNFNNEDGLAQSQVLSICQDRFGNMWFGTNAGGVSIYDGFKFKTLNDNDSLVGNVVYSITRLKNEKIILGTNEGMSIYNGKIFKNYTVKDGLPHRYIFKIIQDKKDNIWIATANGVCQLVGCKIKLFTADTLLSKSSVFTMFEDSNSNIWFGTIGNGVIKYEPSNNKFKYYSTKDGFKSNSIKDIKEDGRGNIYVATTYGIKKINTKGEVMKVDIENEEDRGFTSIVRDNDDNMWLSTKKGVYKYNETSSKLFLQTNGLPGNDIFSSYKDTEGNLWFGTMGNGVTKFGGETFVTYSSKDLIPGDNIESVFIDSKGNKWFGISDNAGLYMINKDGELKSFYFDVKNLNGSIPGNHIQAVLEDKEGKMYFGTNAGLCIFNGKSFENFRDLSKLPSNNILHLYFDKNETLWIGTVDGLCIMKNKKIEEIPIINNLRSKGEKLPFYDILQDRHNIFYFATENGVIKYDGKTAIRLNEKNGFTDKRVLSIAEDQKGNLWFGTDEGVFSYRENVFTNINTKNGLSANKVYVLLIDDLNNLWAGTTSGLDNINLSIYYSINKVQISHFGKGDGFKGLECNVNAKFKDKEGKLWFGTARGAIVYNPRYYKKNKIEANTRINNIRLFFNIDNETLKKYSKSIDSTTFLPTDLKLPYDINHITFDFIAVSLTNPLKIKYQFKLIGADKDWFPPTTNTQTTYSSLEPGEYTFYLKACNNEGLWNKTPLTFKFTILPPYYRTWWFYALAVMIFVSSIYGYIYWRTKNFERTKLILENQVKMRTAQLREEKEKVEQINQEVIEQKRIIENKNNDITDSIKYAKNIQEALLPPLINIYSEFNEAFIMYMPKDIVSGDFYWFAKRNNKRFIASVDCTGHGVPGAFMSIIGNTLLNEIVNDKNITQPAEILNELHIGVKQALKQSNRESERRDGMDIALCSLNEDSTLLEYAGANRPLWIFRKNKDSVEALEIIKPNKFPIGGLEIEENEKRKFTNHLIPLQKGDLFYIFTDGFADQFGGPKGKKFMVGNFQKLLSTIHKNSIAEQHHFISKGFTEWKGELEQVDDVLIIAFRV